MKPGDKVKRLPFELKGDLTLKLKWKSKSSPWPGVSRHPGGEFFYVSIGETAIVKSYDPDTDELFVEGVGVALSGRTFQKLIKQKGKTNEKKEKTNS